MGTQESLPVRRRLGLRRVIQLLLLIGTLPVTLPAWSSEAAVRVAFVYNFIKFIDWPGVDDKTPFHLCVLDAVGETRIALDQLKGMAANKQVIDLLYFSDKSTVGNNLASCQMVYRPARPIIFSLPHPLPVGVVLVADEAAPNETDVSIVLVKQADDRLTFVVNQSAINRAGVKVSSQLLKLGTVIHEGNN